MPRVLTRTPAHARKRVWYARLHAGIPLSWTWNRRWQQCRRTQTPYTLACLCGAELAITHLPLTCPHCHRMWLKES